MTSLEKFAKINDVFNMSQLMSDMLNTVEASPWHREANVMVHTEMLISWYIDNYFANRSEKQRLYSLICCLFHDVGKPATQQDKVFSDGSVGHSYHGHEGVSARLWVDFAVSNMPLINDIGLTLKDAADISFGIEHHLPYDTKKEFKRVNLRKSIISRIGKDGEQAWIDFLLCDQNGRISDGQEEKLNKVNQWVNDWVTINI